MSKSNRQCDNALLNLSNNRQLVYEAMFSGEQKGSTEDSEKEELIDPLPGKMKKAVVSKQNQNVMKYSFAAEILPYFITELNVRLL